MKQNQNIEKSSGFTPKQPNNTFRTEQELIQSIRAKGYQNLDPEEANLVERQRLEAQEDTKGGLYGQRFN